MVGGTFYTPISHSSIGPEHASSINTAVQQFKILYLLYNFMIYM